MYLQDKKLNGNMLKGIAILAMTVDHAAWLFLPLESAAAQLCHIIGRLTFPIMAYMIVEGYHHTRNVENYLRRLAVSAVIAHFAYAFCFQHPYIFDFQNRIVDTTSVLWGFTFGLMALIIYRSEKLKTGVKVLLILLSILCSVPSDWSWVCVVFLLLMDMNYGNFKKMFFWTLLFGWSYALVYCLIASWQNAYQFAVILAYPLLWLYNGQRGSWKGMKWFFYLYYPLHLVLLGLIRVILAQHPLF